MQAETGTPYNREFLRKAAPIFYWFLDAGWVNPPAGAEQGGVSTHQLNKDGTQSSSGNFAIDEPSKLNDPNYILTLHGFDPSEFELVSAKSSKWQSFNKDNLYSSQIIVKPFRKCISEKHIDEWFDRLQRDYVAPDIKPVSYGCGDALLVIPMSDLHFNLQATLFTTGNEYNCQIAEQLFFDVISDAIEQSKDYKISKIVLTIGGDMMNADGPTNTTTRGTPQDCDLSYYDACERMYAMTVKAVDMLSHVAPVHVVYVPGNHDNLTGYKLAKYVDAWFRDDADIDVDISPKPRKYFVFGKTLFVFAHDGDIKTLPQLIADEARSVWSDIDFTEVMLQHLHSEQILSEKYAMRIQRLPSVCGLSKWANDSGYRSTKQCKSFVYDKDKGLRRTIYTPVS